MEQSYHVCECTHTPKTIVICLCACFIELYYRSELGWDLGFEIGFSVDIALGAPVGSPLVYSINMLLGLELFDYFVTRKVSLVGVSLGPMYGLMLGTGEEYLAGLSLGLLLGSPLEYPNNGSDLTVMLLSVTLGLCFSS